MNFIRALFIGILIWIIGVTAFTVFFEIPFLEDSYLQANIGLAIVVPFLVWIGAKMYYRKGALTHGIVTGLIMLTASAALDALITVPMLIIPFGGSYASFFGSLDFWLIAAEFIGVVFLYWLLKIRTVNTN